MSGSIHIYIYIYIYIWKEIKFKYHIIFWITKLQTLKKKKIIIALNTYHLLLLTIHKNILSLTKYYGKKKYYGELISDE